MHIGILIHSKARNSNIESYLMDRGKISHVQLLKNRRGCSRWVPIGFAATTTLGETLELTLSLYLAVGALRSPGLGCSSLNSMRWGSQLRHRPLFGKRNMGILSAPCTNRDSRRLSIWPGDDRRNVRKCLIVIVQ
jgi:hypothetical protein